MKTIANTYFFFFLSVVLAGCEKQKDFSSAQHNPLVALYECVGRSISDEPGKNIENLLNSKFEGKRLGEIEQWYEELLQNTCPEAQILFEISKDGEEISITAITDQDQAVFYLNLNFDLNSQGVFERAWVASSSYPK